MLSISTDYVSATGYPEPHLRHIAEAGFSYVHWCHHFNTDFLYADSEIEQIARWLKEYDLKVNDLHGSGGVEKGWMSYLEYERLAGVELAKNRIRMTAKLSSDVTVMHMPIEPENAERKRLYWTQAQKTLDALQPFARDHGVRIAVENLYPDNWHTIENVFSKYDADYIGLCYDSGHGNLHFCSDGLEHLDRLKGRLIALHLCDNDGYEDQHNPLFSGTVDWEKLAQIIAASPYAKCTNMEINMKHSGIESGAAFLREATKTGTAFERMVDELGTGQRSHDIGA
jgi:sugar phosphate isomerase/epimerase